MLTLHEVLQNFQLVVYTALSVAAFLMWRRRPDASHGWIAATFGLLGAIIVIGRFIPRNSDAVWVLWTTKLLIAALVLFPYFLYRFVATIRRPYKWIFNSAAGLTTALTIWVMFLPAIPKLGERPGGAFQAWVILLAFQWSALSGIVAARLWREGRGQPNVAKRRMQTLALGALGLSGAVVVAIAAGTTIRPRGIQIFSQFVVLASAPLFLAGFAPPGPLLTFWRRHEQAALEEATFGLMKATTSEEVAAAILPQASALFGGRGACLFDGDGNVVGSFGLDERDLQQFLADRSGWQNTSEVVLDKLMVRVPVEKGWLIMVSSSFAPFFGEEEVRLLKTLAVFVDTALERARLVDQERRYLEAMRDFLAIAAHDLRTPVTVITGFAKLLASQWNDYQDSEKVEMVNSIERQSSHLTRLTEDLLMLSRMEAEGVDSFPCAVSVKSAIEGILNDLPAEHADSTNVSIDSKLMVYVDPDHFDRIIVNYLNNAYVYGQAPYCVEAFKEDGGITIVVKDQGAGVPVEFAPSLFEKFARLDKKTSKSSSGTGLGLSIVKGLAQAAGGRAWYQPNRPSGAAFAVQLPEAA